MSTMPVSNRSTQLRTPVAGSVSHFALPRLVSSIPSTRIGASAVARTGSAIATIVRFQVFHVVPQAADTSATERHPSSTAAAISAFGADGEPGSRRDLRDGLGELLPGKRKVAAQPFLFAPQQIRDVRADLHVLRAGHHPALGSGGDDLAQRAPTDPRRRGEHADVAGAVGADTDQVDVDIGQPEKQ